MDAASYIAAAGMKTSYEAVNVASNNLANANSPGFKADRPFYRLLQEQVELSGSRMAGTSTDFSAGTMKTTGNPLDLAIEGDGFFSIRTPNGTQYTRNGNFSISQTGELVTQEGFAVLDNRGQTIPIIREAGAPNEVSISKTGEIMVDQQIVATLGIYRFDDTATLSKEGDLAWSTDSQPRTVANPMVEQGTLEQSNVNTIRAMLDLVEMNRVFEINQRTIRTLMNSINRRAITEIAAQA